MPQPFGGHPTLGQYLTWAKHDAGCDVQQGITSGPDGAPYNITKIIAPSGRWVIDVGTQHSEFLVPTTVARFDRRLGLESPYFSIDDSGYTPTTE